MLSYRVLFTFFLWDQRWNRWGRGREGGKALFTFLPFYLFTFKSLLPFKDSLFQ